MRCVMQIEAYDFGNIDINGQRYTSDLKIINSHIKPNWWRKNGHLLHLEDIKDIIEAKPRIVIVGTGYSGLMHLADGLIENLQELGIETEALLSKKAVQRFNELIKKYGAKQTAFAIHLTC